MSEYHEPTPEELRRANLRDMTDAQLDAEHAAVAAQASPSADYLGYLRDEYKHRGRKPPE